MAATYCGFEQGPIRPPSEANSLLLRVTRGCPWNRCTFCDLYRQERFTIRPVADVLADIDAVRTWWDRLEGLAGKQDGLRQADIAALAKGSSQAERMALAAALNWWRSQSWSVFLQDSNSLVVRPDDLVTILDHLRSRFPAIERITSYARARTIAKISDHDLARLRAAGLNRIHIGMESGSDRILKRIRKGVDKASHILAGQKVKQAGMELSEYWIPGIGGRELSRENSLESADTLNSINPDFIRLRTLALPDHLDLAVEARAGRFEKLGDVATAREILLFIQSLSGITSMVKSDHILNLLEEVEGRLPQEQVRMAAAINRFLSLEPDEQVLYQVGRRTGLMRCLDDLQDQALRHRAAEHRRLLGATPETVDAVVDTLLTRFI